MKEQQDTKMYVVTDNIDRFNTLLSGKKCRYDLCKKTDTGETWIQRYSTERAAFIGGCKLAKRNEKNTKVLPAPYFIREVYV